MNVLAPYGSQVEMNSASLLSGEEVFVFPLSFEQQRLWFLDQLEPNNPFYNIPAALRLCGSLDLVALERGLNEIVQRHEVLRTTFVVMNEHPVQAIAASLSVPITMIDLQAFPETEREVKVQQLATEEAQRPFDLAQGPLLRSTVLCLGVEEHVLLVSMHHIISDGWSAGVFIRELAAFYTAFSANKPASLPELPVQYADCVIWQREWLQGEVLEQQLAYWKKKLAGAPALLELPTDRPRPPVQTFRGGTRSIILSVALSQALEALSRQEGTTLFMTLLAAFQTLLSRYSGQQDVVVGTPIANRSRPELEGLIGLFANTLMLRADLSGNPSFRKLLGQVRESCLEAYAYQDAPFEKLVEELRPERDLSRSPLFQVMFMLQNSPLSALKFPGLTLTPLEVNTGIAKFDLTLSVTGTRLGLKASLEYNSSLFDEVTIERMLGHLQLLLEGIVSDPQRRLSELPLLSEGERRLLLEVWGRGPVEHIPPLSVHQCFEAQVQRSPRALAVVFAQQHLTYHDLNSRANQLAYYLRGLGVGPEVRVAISLERSLDMLVALLAVLKAGGAYVPLDPAYPQQRLDFMLQDACPAVLLTQQHLLPNLPAHQAQAVLLDCDWPTIATCPDHNLPGGALPANLAYVLYTSGSTGAPKGVQVTHAALLNLLCSMQQQPGLTHTDVLAAITTLSFDIAALELYLPLLVGACLVLLSHEESADGQLLRAALATSAVTAMQATPATWQLLLDVGWQASPSFQLLCGGEALAAELAHRLTATGAPLWNLYGPTETTVWSSLHRVDQSMVDPIPLGHPIANTQLYVLDASLQPVPIAVIGEVYIGGAGLARGYLHRADLTAERFIPHPFATHGGERLYRTGDLARFQADGSLAYVGRTDTQIKLRGYRIELGEIEVALREHASVQQAVVLMREEAQGDKRLVAYIVATPKRAAAEQSTDETGWQPTRELQAFLRTKLPEYMLPSAFVLLEQLPLTPNGKVDRRALPAPQWAGDETTAIYLAPRTPIEEVLAELWAEVLGVDQARISVHANFFELGGHSLLATRTIARLRDVFAVEIPLRALFEVPTVAGLAERIEAYLSEGSGAAITATKVLDLEAEAVLDPIISPAGLPLTNSMDPSRILLTGATGFLGAFLLEELLRQTKADVFCLVRATDPEDGRKRIERVLRSFQIWDDSFSSRIFPVVGDLAKPLLGCSQAQFMELAATIDVIYHSGAFVNFIYPYFALKAINVLGTQEILRLACSVKVKALHHISTLDIFASRNYEDHALREEDLPRPGNNHLGYMQSKWVAEKLVASAKSRGLPVCIYRPWLITGHSETGVTHTTDYNCVALKGCIQLGIVPDQGLQVNVIPVDYVSQGIVYLSRQENSFGKIFHFANQHLARAELVYGWIRSLGYPLDTVHYPLWHQRVMKVDQFNALYPLVPLLAQAEELYPDMQIDCSNTLEGLKKTDIICPPVNEKHIRACLMYLVDVGFLNPPDEHDRVRQGQMKLKAVTAARSGEGS